MGIIAILFSFFVLSLWCFHTFIIGINQTTQEKLNHKFTRFPRSPYSYGNACKNWMKVILCPRKRAETRLSWTLYLKSNFPEQYDEVVKEKGLPEMMREVEVEVY